MGLNWALTPMPYGPEWRLCRKLLHEQFNRHQVVHYAAQLEESTHAMLRDLLSTPDDFYTHVQQCVVHLQLRCATCINALIIPIQVGGPNRRRYWLWNRHRR